MVDHCEVCGNEYDKAFHVSRDGADYVFDSLECAIEKLAPRCEVCGIRIIGHGLEHSGRMFCSAHCAKRGGETELRDRI